MLFSVSLDKARDLYCPSSPSCDRIMLTINLNEPVFLFQPLGTQ